VKWLLIDYLFILQPKSKIKAYYIENGAKYGVEKFLELL